MKNGILTNWLLYIMAFQHFETCSLYMRGINSYRNLAYPVRVIDTVSMAYGQTNIIHVPCWRLFVRHASVKGGGYFLPLIPPFIWGGRVAYNTFPLPPQSYIARRLYDARFPIAFSRSRNIGLQQNLPASKVCPQTIIGFENMRLGPGGGKASMGIRLLVRKH